MTPAQIIARAKDLGQEKATPELLATILEAIQAYAQSDLVDEKEAAVILGTTPGTLQVWRSTRRYAIPFVKVGRRVLPA